MALFVLAVCLSKDLTTVRETQNVDYEVLRYQNDFAFMSNFGLKLMDSRLNILVKVVQLETEAPIGKLEFLDLNDGVVSLMRVFFPGM